MRWRLVASSLGAAAAIGACSAFSTTASDAPEPTSEAGVDAPTEPDAPGGPSDAGGDGALASGCLGTTATWNLETTTPPARFASDTQNSPGQPFTTLFEGGEGGAPFGRFVQALSNDSGDGGARFGVAVEPSTTHACLSVRIRHPLGWPAQPFDVEELVAVFSVGATADGFRQLLISGDKMVATCNAFDDGSVTSATTSREAVGVASADWHVWRLEMVRGDGGLHLGLLLDGQVLGDCVPFPSGQVPAGGVLGFGPRPFSSVLDASVTIDVADVRVDLD